MDVFHFLVDVLEWITPLFQFTGFLIKAVVPGVLIAVAVKAMNRKWPDREEE